LPGEANITTAAGDVATFQSTGANTVQCINYTRATGVPVVVTATATELNYLDITTLGTSEASKALTADANGIVTLDQDTDNEALIIDCESTSDYATRINAKYGLRVEQDISSGYTSKFYRNIAEAGSNPLVIITDDHTSNTQPALKIQQDGAGHGLQIDQNGDSVALYIDSESTNQYGIKVYSKYGIYSNQDISGGYAGKFIRNIAEAGSNPLVLIVDDHTSNTQPALSIQQDGAGHGIHIDQNGEAYGIFVDSEATSGNPAIKTTGKNGIYCVQDISGGQAGSFYRNIDEAGSNSLVHINDTHTSNTQPALRINQDGAGYGLEIDQNGNSDAINIDTETTTGKGIYVAADALTSGFIARLYSNSATTDTRNLVEIWNANAAATGATTLKVRQDSTGAAAVFDGNVGIGADFSPSTALEVEFNNTSTTDFEGIFINNISNTDDSSASLIFSNDSGGRKKAAISYVDEGAYGTGSLRFYLDTDFSGGVLDKSTDEAMRIDYAGNIKFNGSANITSNTADGSDSAQIVISGGGSTVSADTRGASIHLAGNENGNAGLLQLRAGSGSIGGIRMYSGGSERARITDDGITFNADTAAANALDDYEEGTWTPVFAASTTTVTVGSATYTKIGRVVNFQFYLGNISPATSGDPQQITGLPFTHAGSGSHSAASIAYCANADLNEALPIIAASQTHLYFHRNDGNGASLTRSDFNGKLASGLSLIISGTYVT